MSKISKICKKEKHEFNRALQNYAQSQIDEFVYGLSAIDREIEAAIAEEKTLNCLDYQIYQDAWFDFDDMIEEEEEINRRYREYEYDNYPYDEDYRDDEIYYNSVYGINGCEVGEYYKSISGHTLFCVQIERKKYLINVHTGLIEHGYSEFDLRLQKIG